jgi:hypothetical protein
LIVIKHVDNTNIGIASDYTIHVSGNNALPSDFAGSESGTTVKMGEGPYAVSEIKPIKGGEAFASYSNDCSGILGSG